MKQFICENLYREHCDISINRLLIVSLLLLYTEFSPLYSVYSPLYTLHTLLFLPANQTSRIRTPAAWAQSEGLTGQRYTRSGLVLDQGKRFFSVKKIKSKFSAKAVRCPQTAINIIPSSRFLPLLSLFFFLPSFLFIPLFLFSSFEKEVWSSFYFSFLSSV